MNEEGAGSSSDGRGEGEYSQCYSTEEDLIGEGAFGRVALSQRKRDGLQTVTKFVLVSDVLWESWVGSPRRGHRLVPMEVHLLEQLQHPNIIKLIEVFESPDVWSIVTERRENGMDLFEFMRRRPKMDEPLIAHIFRQVVSAVSHLLSLSIVHRDIKDENVIIDCHFNCVLIDFGSAAYYGKDIAFSTYTGTINYASPEVLRGEIYLGPPQEIWSLGVLLYSLSHLRLPFNTQQDILNANMTCDRTLSEELELLLRDCLQAQPTDRISIEFLEKDYWLHQTIDIDRYSFNDVINEIVEAGDEIGTSDNSDSQREDNFLAQIEI